MKTVTFLQAGDGHYRELATLVMDAVPREGEWVFFKPTEGKKVLLVQHLIDQEAGGVQYQVILVDP